MIVYWSYDEICKFFKQKKLYLHISIKEPILHVLIWNKHYFKQVSRSIEHVSEKLENF